MHRFIHVRIKSCYSNFCNVAVCTFVPIQLPRLTLYLFFFFKNYEQIKNANLGMKKIIRALCPNLKTKMSNFIIRYRISQENNRIFQILGLCYFVFTTLTIDITLTQHNFLPSN